MKSGSTEMRRIVLVGPAHPFRGGIAHFSNRLSRALAGSFDVQLLTFSRQYPQILFPGKSQFEDSDWDLPSEPQQRIDSINPLSWRSAGKWLAEQEPDVIMLVHWLPFFVPAYLGVLRAYRRSLRDDQKPAHTNIFLHNVFPHKPFPFTRPLMGRLLSKGDSFFTLSGHVTEHLKGIVPNPRVLEGFHPVYDIFEPAIDSAEARSILGLSDRPTMIFFGYVRHYKGLDLLIEALPLVRNQVDAQVIVAGEFYENREEIEARIEQLGLAEGPDPAVKLFSDYIPNEEVHLYFSAADVVVQPYRSATPSGVAQTAFFFEKPMIVTDLGVLAEVVPDGKAGFVVPPEDPGQLADAVIRFFERGAESFREGVREQRQRFSWDELASQLTSFLKPENSDEQ
jgi:glycosyltransferase involved in cell wall biosynthesis